MKLWPALIGVTSFLGCTTADSEATPTSTEAPASSHNCEAPADRSHLVPSAVNPNGDSPLALTMRAMRDDVQAWRAALLDAGLEPATVAARMETHRRVLTDAATVPADRDEAFLGLAGTYVQLIEDLAARPSAERFDAAVAACQACHRRSCRGPLVVIDRLPIAPSEAL